MIKLNEKSNQSLIINMSVIQVFLNTLKEIDSRLVEHGERVAYIIYKMLTDSNKFPESEINKVFILALFHDIGAYKTEEIDNLFNFETKKFDDHSIYGYLF